MPETDIGSLKLNLGVALTGYEDAIKHLQELLDKVVPNSAIGRELKKSLTRATQQYERLQKRDGARVSRPSELTRIQEQSTDLAASLQQAVNLASQIKFPDLKPEVASDGIKELIAQLAQLQQQAQTIKSTSFSEAFSGMLETSSKLEEAMQAVELDPKSLNADNFLEALKEASKKASDIAVEIGEQITANMGRKAALGDKVVQKFLKQFDGVNLGEELQKRLQITGDESFQIINQDKLQEAISAIRKTLSSNLIDSDTREQIQLQLNEMLKISDPTQLQSALIATQNSLGKAFGSQDKLKRMISAGEGSTGWSMNDIFSATSFTEVDTGKLQQVSQLLTTMAESFGNFGMNGEEVSTFVSDIMEAFESKGAQSGVTMLVSSFTQFITKAREARDEINSLTQQNKTLGSRQMEMASYSRTLERSGEELSTAYESRTADGGLQQTLTDISNVNEAIGRLGDENAEKVSQLGEDIREKVGGAAAEVKGQVDEATGSLHQMSAAQEAIGQVEGFVKKWFSFTAAIRMASQAVKSMISTIKEVDKTITQISIVTDMSSSDLWGSMSSYVELAKEYGASVAGVYQVSQLYYQQGLQTADVMTLTTETLKFARVSGLEYADATNYMTNALRSFKMEMSEAGTIADVYSALAASSASSAKELAIAMSKTASSAQAAGATFENTAAMMAVMIEATREAPENIGSAMKSIISRYGEMTSDPTKLVDSEGEEMSLNRVDKALQTVGISLHDAMGNFRSFDEVIMELAKSWDTIDTNTQRYIATIMAGNRQQSRFLALVSSYDRLKQLSATAADSENTAQLQYLKTLDSIETKQTILSDTMQSMYLSSGLQDAFKVILDIGTAIVDLFADISSTGKTGFASLATTVSTIGGTFYNLANVVSAVGKLIIARVKIVSQELDAYAAQKAAERASRAEAANQQHNQNIENQARTHEQTLNNIANEGANQRSAAHMGGKAGAAKLGISAPSVIASLVGVAATGVGAAFNAAGNKIGAGISNTIGSTATGVSMGAMITTALGATGPVGLVLGGIAGALVGFLQNFGLIFQSAEDKAKELKEKAEEASNEYLTKSSETKKLSNSIDELRKLEAHMYDSTEAQEAYYEAANKMAEKYPQLIQSMDDAGNVILDLNAAEIILADSRKESAEAARKAAVANYAAAKAEADNAREKSKSVADDFKINFNGQTLHFYTPDGNVTKGYFYDPLTDTTLLDPNVAPPAYTLNDKRLEEITTYAQLIAAGDIEAIERAEKRIEEYNANVARGYVYDNPEETQEKYTALGQLLNAAGRSVEVADYRRKDKLAKSTLRSGLAMYLPALGISTNYSVFSEMANAQSGLLSYAESQIYSSEAYTKDLNLSQQEYDEYLKNSFNQDAQDYAIWLQSIWNQLDQTKREQLNALIKNSSQYTENEFQREFANIIGKSVKEIEEDQYAQAFVKDTYREGYKNDTYNEFYSKRNKKYSIKDYISSQELSAADMQGIIAAQERLDKYVEQGQITVNSAEDFASKYATIIQNISTKAGDNTVLKNAAEKLVFSWTDWSVTGVNNLKDQIEAIFGDVDASSVITAIDELAKYIPYSLKTEIALLEKNTKTNFEKVEKRFKSAQSGMNWGEASTFMEETGLNWTDLDLVDTKWYFRGDYTKLLDEDWQEDTKQLKTYQEKIGNQATKINQLQTNMKMWINTGTATDFDTFFNTYQDSIHGWAEQLSMTDNEFLALVREYYAQPLDSTEQRIDFASWAAKYMTEQQTNIGNVVKAREDQIQSFIASMFLKEGDIKDLVDYILPDANNDEKQRAINDILNGTVPAGFETISSLILGYANDNVKSVFDAIIGGIKDPTSNKIKLTAANRGTFQQLATGEKTKNWFKLPENMDWDTAGEIELNTQFLSQLSYSDFIEALQMYQGNKQELINAFVAAHEADNAIITGAVSLASKKVSDTISLDEWTTYQKSLGNTLVQGTDEFTNKLAEYGLKLTNYGQIVIENYDTYLQKLREDVDTATDGVQRREAQIKLNSAIATRQHEDTINERSAFKDVITNYNNISQSQYDALATALGDKFDKVSDFIKWDQLSGSYQLDYNAFSAAVENNSLDLEKGVQQYILSLLNQNVDSMLKYVSDAAKLQTSGTTSFSEMQSFVDEYNKLTGEQKDISQLFTYNEGTESFLLNNEWALVLVEAEAQQVADTMHLVGDARNDFINKWIQDNYTEQLVDVNALDKYLTNTTRTEKDKNLLKNQLIAKNLYDNDEYQAEINKKLAAAKAANEAGEQRAAVARDNYLSGVPEDIRETENIQDTAQKIYSEQYKLAYDQAYAEALKASGFDDVAAKNAELAAEAAAKLSLETFEAGGQAAVDEYLKYNKDATGEQLEAAYRGGITSIQSAMKRIPELVKGSFVGTSGVLHDAAVAAGFQIDGNGLVAACGNVVAAVNDLYERLRNDANATASEIGDAYILKTQVETQSTRDAISLMGSTDNLTTEALTNILKQYGIDAEEFITKALKLNYITNNGNGSYDILDLDNLLTLIQTKNNSAILKEAQKTYELAREYGQDVVTWALSLSAEEIEKLPEYEKSLANDIKHRAGSNIAEWNPDTDGRAYWEAQVSAYNAQREAAQKPIQDAINGINNLSLDKLDQPTGIGSIVGQDNLSDALAELQSAGITVQSDTDTIVLNSAEQLYKAQEILLKYANIAAGGSDNNWANMQLENANKALIEARINNVKTLLSTEGIDAIQRKQNEQIFEALGIQLKEGESIYEEINGQNYLTQAARQALLASENIQAFGQDIYDNSVYTVDQIKAMLNVDVAKKVDLRKYRGQMSKAEAKIMDANVEQWIHTLSEDSFIKLFTEGMGYSEHNARRYEGNRANAAKVFIKHVQEADNDEFINMLYAYMNVIGEALSTDEVNALLNSRITGLQKVQAFLNGKQWDKALEIDAIQYYKEVFGDNAVEFDENSQQYHLAEDVRNQLSTNASSYITTLITLLLEAGAEVSEQYFADLDKQNKVTLRSLAGKRTFSSSDLNTMYNETKIGEETAENWKLRMEEQYGLQFNNATGGWEFSSFENQMAALGNLYTVGSEAYNAALAEWNQNSITANEAAQNRRESQAQALVGAKKGREVDISSLIQQSDLKKTFDYFSADGRKIASQSATGTLTFDQNATLQDIYELKKQIIENSNLTEEEKQTWKDQLEDELKSKNLYTAVSGITSNLSDISAASITLLETALKESGAVLKEGEVKSWFTANGKGGYQISASDLREKIKAAGGEMNEQIQQLFWELLDTELGQFTNAFTNVNSFSTQTSRNEFVKTINEYLDEANKITAEELFKYDATDDHRWEIDTAQLQTLWQTLNNKLNNAISITEKQAIEAVMDQIHQTLLKNLNYQNFVGEGQYYYYSKTAEKGTQWFTNFGEYSQELNDLYNNAVSYYLTEGENTTKEQAENLAFTYVNAILAGSETAIAQLESMNIPITNQLRLDIMSKPTKDLTTAIDALTSGVGTTIDTVTYSILSSISGFSAQKIDNTDSYQITSIPDNLAEAYLALWEDLGKQSVRDTDKMRATMANALDQTFNITKSQNLGKAAGISMTELATIYKDVDANLTLIVKNWIDREEAFINESGNLQFTSFDFFAKEVLRFSDYELAQNTPMVRAARRQYNDTIIQTEKNVIDNVTNQLKAIAEITPDSKVRKVNISDITAQLGIFNTAYLNNILQSTFGEDTYIEEGMLNLGNATSEAVMEVILSIIQAAGIEVDSAALEISNATNLAKNGQKQAIAINELIKNRDNVSEELIKQVADAFGDKLSAEELMANMTYENGAWTISPESLQHLIGMLGGTIPDWLAQTIAEMSDNLLNNSVISGDIASAANRAQFENALKDAGVVIGETLFKYDEELQSWVLTRAGIVSQFAYLASQRSRGNISDEAWQQQADKLVNTYATAIDANTFLSSGNQGEAEQKLKGQIKNYLVAKWARDGLDASKMTDEEFAPYVDSYFDAITKGGASGVEAALKIAEATGKDLSATDIASIYTNGVTRLRDVMTKLESGVGQVFTKEQMELAAELAGIDVEYFTPVPGTDTYILTQMPQDLYNAYYTYWLTLKENAETSIKDLNAAAIKVLETQYNMGHNSINASAAAGMTMADLESIYNLNDMKLNPEEFNNLFTSGTAYWVDATHFMFDSLEDFMDTVTNHGAIQLNPYQENAFRQTYYDQANKLNNRIGNMSVQQLENVQGQLESAITAMPGQTVNLSSLRDTFGEDGLRKIQQAIWDANFTSTIDMDGQLLLAASEYGYDILSTIIRMTVTDPATQNELLAQVAAQKIKVTPDNGDIQALIVTREKITEDQIGSLATSLGMTYADFVSHLSKNGENYSISLDEIKNIAGIKGIELNEETNKQIEEIITNAYDTAISLAGKATSGFSLTDQTNFFDTFRIDGGYIGEQQLSLEELQDAFFHYDRQLNTWFLTQSGMSAMLEGAAEQLGGSDSAKYQHFLLSMERELAGAIDIFGYLGAENRGEDGLAYQTLTKSLDNYNMLLTSLDKETLDTAGIINNLNKGGLIAVDTGADIVRALSGKELTNDQVKQLYQSNLTDIQGAITGFQSGVGTVVSTATAELLKDAGVQVSQLDSGHAIITSLGNDIAASYRSLWNKLKEKGNADLADLNNLVAATLTASYNVNNQSYAKEMVSGVSFEQLAKIFTDNQRELTEEWFKQAELSGAIMVRDGKAYIRDIDAIASFANIETGSREYWDLVYANNENMINWTKEEFDNATSALTNVFSAKRGSQVNMTRFMQYTDQSEDAINELIGIYGGEISNGILSLSDTANVGAIGRVLAQQFGDKIPDSIKDLLTQQIDAAIDGLSTLGNAQTQGLTKASELRSYMDQLTNAGITAINGNAISIESLFYFNEQLQTYMLTTDGIMSQMMLYVQQMETANDTEKAAMQAARLRLGRQLAEAIDFESFISAEDQSEGSQAWITLKTAVDNYNAWAQSMGKEVIVFDKLAEQLTQGGTSAVQAAQYLAAQQGKTLSSDQIVSIYQSGFQKLNIVYSEMTANVGEIVSKETMELLTKHGYSFRNIDGTSSYVITSLGNHLENAYFELAQQMTQTAGATLKQYNEVMLAGFKAQTKDADLGLLQNAAEMSLDEFTDFLTRYGVTLTKDFFDNGKNGFILKGNKVKALDYASFAKFIGIDPNSDEYLTGFAAYNDALLEADKQVTELVNTQLQNLINARKGDTINVSTLSSKISDFETYVTEAGATFEKGFLTIGENTNILKLSQSLVTAAAEAGVLLDEDVQTLLESLDNLFKTITDSISKGIKGTLSQTEAVDLQDNLKAIGIDMELDFTKTADGLKLSRATAIELYSELRKINSVAAKPLFTELKDTLTSAGENAENISDTLATIANLQRQVDALSSAGANAEQKKTQELQNQLALYKEIALQQALTQPETYNFMGRSLPTGLQGPTNAYNSFSTFKSTLDTAAKEGTLSWENFYNMVDFVNSQAAMAGETIVFMGQKLDGSLGAATQAIETGISGLKFAADGSLAVDLKTIGIDLAAGADGMLEGSNEFIHNFASAQIKMLDPIIAFLEMIVAMEGLDELSGENNVIDLSELFPNFTMGENGSADGVWDKNEKAVEIFTKLMSADPDSPMGKMLDGIKIGDKTLRTLMTAYNEGKGLSKEVATDFTELINSLIAMSKSDEWTGDNWQDMIDQYLPKNFTGEITLFDDTTLVVDQGWKLIRGKDGTYEVDGEKYTDPKTAFAALRLNANTGFNAKKGGITQNPDGSFTVETAKQTATRSLGLYKNGKPFVLTTEVPGVSYNVQFDKSGNPTYTYDNNRTTTDYAEVLAWQKTKYIEHLTQLGWSAEQAEAQFNLDFPETVTLTPHFKIEGEINRNNWGNTEARKVMDYRKKFLAWLQGEGALGDLADVIKTQFNIEIDPKLKSGDMTATELETLSELFGIDIQNLRLNVDVVDQNGSNLNALLDEKAEINKTIKLHFKDEHDNPISPDTLAALTGSDDKNNYSPERTAPASVKSLNSKYGLTPGRRSFLIGDPIQEYREYLELQEKESQKRITKEEYNRLYDYYEPKYGNYTSLSDALIDHPDWLGVNPSQTLHNLMTSYFGEDFSGKLTISDNEVNRTLASQLFNGIANKNGGSVYTAWSKLIDIAESTGSKEQLSALANWWKTGFDPAQIPTGFWQYDWTKETKNGLKFTDIIPWLSNENLYNTIVDGVKEQLENNGGGSKKAPETTPIESNTAALEANTAAIEANTEAQGGEAGSTTGIEIPTEAEFKAVYEDWLKADLGHPLSDSTTKFLNKYKDFLGLYTSDAVVLDYTGKVDADSEYKRLVARANALNNPPETTSTPEAETNPEPPVEDEIETIVPTLEQYTKYVEALTKTGTMEATQATIAAFAAQYGSKFTRIPLPGTEETIESLYQTLTQGVQTTIDNVAAENALNQKPEEGGIPVPTSDELSVYEKYWGADNWEGAIPEDALKGMYALEDKYPEWWAQLRASDLSRDPIAFLQRWQDKASKDAEERTAESIEDGASKVSTTITTSTAETTDELQNIDDTVDEGNKEQFTPGGIYRVETTPPTPTQNQVDTVSTAPSSERPAAVETDAGTGSSELAIHLQEMGDQLTDTSTSANEAAESFSITTEYLEITGLKANMTAEQLGAFVAALDNLINDLNTGANFEADELYNLSLNGGTFNLTDDGIKVSIPAGLNEIPSSEVTRVANNAANKLRSYGVELPVKLKIQTETQTVVIRDTTKGGNGGRVETHTFSINSAQAKGTQTLMGELGPELYVSGGHYFIAGQNGAEFVDLPDDAIVFNHLQTQNLLHKGHSRRGSVITSEKAAVSYAKGNAGGPAMASAAATLASLTRIRAMWQKMLDMSMSDFASKGGGGGGGGDKGVDPGFIADLERWYTLLRSIERLEYKIGYEESLRSKIQSDMVRDGDAYYKSQQRSLDALEQELKDNKELAELQQQYYNQRRHDLDQTNYGKIFQFTDEGHMVYNDKATMLNGDQGGLFAISDLNARNPDGSTKYTAKEQYEKLIAWGFESDMKYDSSGKEIDMSKDEGYTQAVQAFWDHLDGWKEELDTLYDDYNQKLSDVIENENKRNAILQAMIDNQLSLEQKVLSAIEDREQAAIDEAQKNRDAIEDSANKFIDGLNQQMQHERDMYDQQQTEQETNKLRRQLAILQRSGGSASQIAQLEQQIAERDQSAYFDAQQRQIDAIQEASDKQLERLDAQIDIMTETLEYQKEHGLLWQEVYEVMSMDEEHILSFITDNGKDWESKSSLQIDKDLNELRDSVEQWLARRDDSKDPFKLNDTHNWDTYTPGAKKRFEHVWTDENVALAKKAFDEEYALTADPNAAGLAADKVFYDKLEEYSKTHPQENTSSSGDIDSNTNSDDNNGSSASNLVSVKFVYLNEQHDVIAPISWRTLVIKQTYRAMVGAKSIANYNLINGTETFVATPGLTVTLIYRAVENKASDKASDSSYIVSASSKDNQKQIISRRIAANNEGEAHAKFMAEYPNYIIKSIKKYAQGGLVDYTGLAMVHGSKNKPEAFLDAETTRMWKEDILGGRGTSLTSLLSEFNYTLADALSAGGINNDNKSVVIENAAVNLNIESIANDYDARRAGEQALEEMLRIARKNSVQSLRR